MDESQLTKVLDKTCELIFEYQRLCQHEPSSARILLGATEKEIERFSNLDFSKILLLRDRHDVSPLCFAELRRDRSGLSMFLDALDSELFDNYIKMMQAKQTSQIASNLKR